MFRQLRILVLLLILFVVAVNTWRQRVRSTRWTAPLYVAIYPIAADASPLTRDYVRALDASSFQDIDAFFAREGHRYGVREDQPVKTRLRRPLDELPPQRAADAGFLESMLWSLKLRYWSSRVSGHAGEPEDIRLFVLYCDPQLTPTVPHSAGLEKGLIGVVYAFSTPVMTRTNEVVMAHELLHTLGATDKYNPRDDSPLFPTGFGDPLQQPPFPQQKGEIMAGRRVVSPTRWVQIPSLTDAVIGKATALEINWPVMPR
jgi:hypothetical protein